MKRVMIVGASGSGKSTLALQLGKLTSLPVYHMDQIHYAPGWVERSPEEKLKLTKEVHQKNSWIFEGGHSVSYPSRVERADTLIWLDYPFSQRLYRVLKRTFNNIGVSRPDLSKDCPDQLNFRMLDFIWFIVRTRKSTRNKIEKIFINNPAHLRVFRFCTDKEVEGFRAGLIKTYRNKLEENT
ncbi:MAG: adenylate kinase family enzyme [Limisphaerales bacterium]|jgi:adenylate kinase family enzyme